MSIPQRFKKASKVLAWLSIALATLILFGWIANLSFFKSILTGWVNLKANVAISFILAGVMVLLWNKDSLTTLQKFILSSAAILIFSISSITLLQYLFHINVGIDEFLFTDSSNVIESHYPGRGTPLSSFCLFLFSVSFLPGIRNVKRPNLFQVINIIMGTTAFIAGAGYVLGTDKLAGLSDYAFLSTHTSLTFLGMMVAALFSKPEEGIMKIISSDTLGGKIFRNAFLIYVPSFILIGWLRLKGEQAGLIDASFGVAIFVIVMLVIFGIVSTFNTNTLVKSESKLEVTDEKLLFTKKRLEKAEELALVGNWEIDYRMEVPRIIWSKQMFRHFGLGPAAKHPTTDEFIEMVHVEDRDDVREFIEAMFKGDETKNKIFRCNELKGSIKYFLPSLQREVNDSGEPEKCFGTLIDVTKMKNAEAQISQYNNQLKNLTANLQNIREEERKRIGREVHDELGQWLTVLKMGVSRIQKIKGDEEKFEDSVEQMLNQINGCILASRKITNDLRPPLIDDLGLIAALEWQAEDFSKSIGINCTFKSSVSKIDLPPDFTIAIFRIFQESLTNVAKHAGASKVECSLFILKGKIHLKIIDNGNGFDHSLVGSTSTLGIIGMKERTLLMEGTYDIRSVIGEGTDITVIIPLPESTKKLFPEKIID